MPSKSDAKLMAELSFTDKNKLEKLFEMKSGYVLNFTDRTFEAFVKDSTGQDIFDSKYDYASGSKANRLRAFWSVESDHIAGKLIHDLLIYLGDERPDIVNSALFNNGCTIALKLLGNNRLRQDKTLAIEPKSTKLQPNGASESRNVFVVHGRNVEARSALFRFLRSIGLRPLEWSHAIELTGKAAPYIGEILDAAFEHAQAVVVLMTPDDEVRLRPTYQKLGDPDHERFLTGQARPNVLFEAGLAIGRHPDRTLLIQLGDLRPFSDIGGRHVIRLNNGIAARQNVANRLKNAGCPVDLAGIDWHTEGNFDAAMEHVEIRDDDNDEPSIIDVNAIFARLSRLGVYDDFYLHYEIPRGSLKNAQDRFLPADEEVLAFLDNTEGDSGRNGVAFTNTGMFWRNSHNEDAQHISWHELADKSIRENNREYEVHLDSDSIDVSCSQVPADELADLLRDIASIVIADLS